MSENNKHSKEVIEKVEAIINKMMDSLMNKVLLTEPFVADVHKTKKPLYAALVPDEIFKGSHFERRFVTPFGKVWQLLACVAAEAGLGSCEQEVPVEGQIPEERLRRIQEVLNNLEHSSGRGTTRTRPNWNEELKYILEGDGELIPVQVNCDLLAKDVQTNEVFAFEVKAPLPNSDQSKVSKEKIFKLYAMEPSPISAAYFALPYNPYGKKADYNWSFPKRWFDMINDPCVLIGDEFWVKIGGPGTYEMFVEEINRIGKHYRERIYTEFLGIEPPEGWDEDILKT